MPTSNSELYDFLLGSEKKPDPPSNEYDPYDPLGLSSDRISCTTRIVVDPWSYELAPTLVQDERGKWIEDNESIEKRNNLMRMYELEFLEDNY